MEPFINKSEPLGKLKILCPYCSAQFTAEMEQDLADSSGCPTCGPIIEGTIDIYCSNCKKLVYRKEI